MLDVIIIGGGFSGLCNAFFASEAGLDFELYEQNSTLGGVIQSDIINNNIIESGANTMRTGKTLDYIINKLNINYSSTKLKTKALIYYKDSLHSPLQLLSPVIIFSLLRGIIFKPKTEPDNSTLLANFISRQFNREILERFIYPFVTGIYAGNPENLLLKPVMPNLYNYFAGTSKTKKTKHKSEIITFSKGLNTFCQEMYKYTKQNIYTNTKIKEIIKNNNTCTVIKEDGTEVQTKNIIIATNSSAASKLYPELKNLENIQYAPIITVNLQVSKQNLANNKTKKKILKNLGFLTAKDNNINILGCLHNSSMFPELYNPEYITLTAFIGGVSHPEYLNYTEQELGDLLKTNIKKIYKINTNNINILKINKYQEAIPQYTQEHQDIINNISNNLPENIYLSSNYIDGVPLEHLAHKAQDIINKISKTKTPVT